MTLRRAVIGLAALAVVGFIAIQFFPIQIIKASMERQTADLPPSQPLDWTSQEVEQLVVTACYDCHSNEIDYPWYSQVAPVSWVVNHHVNNGRKSLNFSEDDFSELDVDDLYWHLQTDMPLPSYLVMHPGARLNAEEQQIVFEGIIASLNLPYEGDYYSESDEEDGA